MTCDLNRMFPQDAFADAIRMGLSLPAWHSVHAQLVIETVAQLPNAPTDPFVSKVEAYETFARTVSPLTVFVAEGNRR